MCFVDVEVVVEVEVWFGFCGFVVCEEVII